MPGFCACFYLIAGGHRAFLGFFRQKESPGCGSQGEDYILFMASVQLAISRKVLIGTET